MSKKSVILLNMFGLWAFGMLVGANAADVLSIQPSWSPRVLLVIGIVGTLGTSGSLYKATGGN
jgi:hypothetical protein